MGEIGRHLHGSLKQTTPEAGVRQTASIREGENETIHLTGTLAHVADVHPSSGLNVAFASPGSQSFVPLPKPGAIAPPRVPRVPSATPWPSQHA